MKSIIVLLVAILRLAGFAQVQKGRSFVTGQLGFGGQDNKTAHSKTSNLNIAGTYGYVFKDNWAVGLSPGYSNSETTNEYASYTTKGYNVSVFARRYLQVVDKLYFSVQGSVGYYGNKSTEDYILTNEYDNRSDSKGVNISLSPGATYFVTDRFAIEAFLTGISYSRSKENSSSGTSHNNTFALNIGITSLSFGASIFF